MKTPYGLLFTLKECVSCVYVTDTTSSVVRRVFSETAELEITFVLCEIIWFFAIPMFFVFFCRWTVL